MATPYEEWMADPETFDTATFNCHMNRSSLRFLSNGQLQVTFNIPPEEVNNALGLRLLARDPLPLTIHVTVLDVFNDHLRALPEVT